MSTAFPPSEAMRRDAAVVQLLATTQPNGRWSALSLELLGDASTLAKRWGGAVGATIKNDGGRYEPLTDSWTPITLTGAPPGRGGHAAAWTGAQMLIVGGLDATGVYYNDNYAYSPPRTV